MTVRHKPPGQPEPPGQQEPLGQQNDKPVAQQKVGFWERVQKRFKRLVTSSENKTTEQNVFDKVKTSSELTNLKTNKLLTTNLHVDKLKQDVKKSDGDTSSPKSSQPMPHSNSSTRAGLGTPSALTPKVPTSIAESQKPKGKPIELSENEKALIYTKLINPISDEDNEEIIFSRNEAEAVAEVVSTGATELRVGKNVRELAESVHKLLSQNGNMAAKKDAIYNYVLECLKDPDLFV